MASVEAEDQPSFYLGLWEEKEVKSRGFCHFYIF